MEAGVLREFEYEKNFEKSEKKVLTNEKRCGIMSESLWPHGGERSLKIEQQERSTKHISMCETDLEQFKKRILLNKSKEAKSKTRKQIRSRGTVFWYNDFESLILAQDERWRRA